MDLKLIQKIYVENNYSGHGWNFEKTTKYVFQLEGMLLEAGYFEHYLDDVYIKSVIELPVSYGCPSHCKFCASSAIEGFQVLTAEHMSKLFKYIYEEYKLSNKKEVVLSMTGIGDIYFNFQNVIIFLKSLYIYSNISVTLSSCMWNKELLAEIENLADIIHIRKLQITYISSDKNILEKLIPIYRSMQLQDKEIINYIKVSKKNYYRYNYILIKDINDSDECFIKYKDNIKQVKDKILVRISKLNKTKATQENNLWPAEKQKMKGLYEMLNEEGISSYMFYSYKNDHMNCGQLITEKCDEGL